MISNRDQHIKRFLQQGGILAYPTESCMGLGCLPTHIPALRRLLRLKKRPAFKGLILTAAYLSQLQGLLQPLNAAEAAAAAQYWPGPYSLLLRYRKAASPYLRGQHAKLAVRISAFSPLHALCKVSGPLVSTSANRAGQPALKTARAVKRAFGSQVKLVRGQIGGAKKPSTVLDPMTLQRFR